ncbi:MAG: ABC transporter ATP-binding protein [Nitrospirae bacterium]|nr:MAG: ABC transporter ATP-binding protein [Nitrospirota bacterium]
MIRLEKITKAFGEQVVFQDLDLTVEKGKTTVILGPSGTGKSVLLKHIVGLLRPDSGRIYLEGRDITDLAGREREALMHRFGFVFQGAALFDSMNVFDNLAFGLRENHLCPESEIPERVARELARVELPGIEEKMPSERSGGMQKRVGLARATIMEPEIILYDEPTTGLDPLTTVHINRLIVRAKEELDSTVVIVTHDVKSALEMADFIAFLDRGRVVAQGTPEEVCRNPNPRLQEFLNARGDVCHDLGRARLATPAAGGPRADGRER